MKLICQKKRVKFIFFVFNLILFTYSLELSQYKVHKDVKTFQVKLNSELFFLNDLDYHKTPSKLNYNKGFQDGITDEFKARLFSYKWAKSLKKKFLIKSVKTSSEKVSNWKIFVIALTNNKGKKVDKKVCFPQNPSENFGLVVDLNQKCANKIPKVMKYLNRRIDNNDSNKQTDIDSAKENLKMKPKLINPIINRIHIKNNSNRKKNKIQIPHSIPKNKEILNNKIQKPHSIPKNKEILNNKNRKYSKNSVPLPSISQTNITHLSIMNNQKQINESPMSTNNPLNSNNTNPNQNFKYNTSFSLRNTYIPPHKQDLITNFTRNSNITHTNDIPLTNNIYSRKDTKVDQSSNKINNLSQINIEANYLNMSNEIHNVGQKVNDLPDKKFRKDIKSRRKTNKIVNKSQYIRKKTVNRSFKNKDNQNRYSIEKIPTNYQELKNLGKRKRLPENYINKQRKKDINSDNNEGFTSIYNQTKAALSNLPQNGNFESESSEESGLNNNNNHTSTNYDNESHNTPYHDKVKVIKDYSTQKKKKNNSQFISKKTKSHIKQRELAKVPITNIENIHLNTKYERKPFSNKDLFKRSLSVSKVKTNFNNLENTSSQTQSRNGTLVYQNLKSEEQHLYAPENLNDYEPLNDEQFPDSNVKIISNELNSPNLGKRNIIKNSSIISNNGEKSLKENINLSRANSTNQYESSEDKDFNRYLKEEKLYEDANNFAPSRINKYIAENYISSYKAKIFLF